MLVDLKHIDKELVDEICRFYKECSHDFIALRKKYYYIDHNVLCSVLYSNHRCNKEKMQKFLIQRKINDKKIIVISDTHYGSEYSRIHYTKAMLKFASRNDIHTVLHCGDILTGTDNPRDGYDEIMQARYFIKSYPEKENITTYAILGNHDYQAIKKEEKVRKIISSRADINILGFTRTYMNWCGKTICLQHECRSFKLCNPLYFEDLAFVGHTHFFHVKKDCMYSDRIYIPAMCDDPKANMAYQNTSPDSKYINTKPGFITAEINGDATIIMKYSFYDYDLVKEDQCLIRAKQKTLV